jgi:hypothetical protein
LSRRRRILALAVAAAAPFAATAVAAPAGHAPLSFTNYPVPSSFASYNFAGEPSIGIDWRTDVVLFQASSSTYQLSLASGRWRDVSSPDSTFNIDPILAMDPESGLALAGGDDGSCSIMSVTTNDGGSWAPSLPCTFTPDHPTVGIGPQAGSSGQQRSLIAYFCQQYPSVDECSRSTDEGLTWLPSTPVTGRCGGLTGHLKFSVDGTAYLPINICQDVTGNGTRVGGAVSTDNGLTWTSYRIPGAIWPSRGFDPTVAVTPDGTVYEAWTSATDNYRPLIAWSHDHGQTWSAPVDVAKGSAFPMYAMAFPAAVAGANGHVAVAYLAADRPPAGGPTAGVGLAGGGTAYDDGYVGAWYLYLSETSDGGRHWSTVRVRPDPVQIGPICDAGTKCVNGRNLLDFMDAGVTSDGNVVIGYADGCAAGCPQDTTGAAPSSDARGVVTVQTGGPSLF